MHLHIFPMNSLINIRLITSLIMANHAGPNSRGKMWHKFYDFHVLYNYFFYYHCFKCSKKQKQIHMENETGQAEWITFTIKSQFKIII